MDIQHIDVSPGKSVLLQLADGHFLVVRAPTAEQEFESAQSESERGQTRDPNTLPPGPIYVPDPPDQITRLFPELRGEIGFVPRTFEAGTAVDLGGFADLRSRA